MFFAMKIDQNMREKKLHHFKSISNATIGVNESFAAKNFGVSCLTSIIDLSHPKIKIQDTENLDIAVLSRV